MSVKISIYVAYHKPSAMPLSNQIHIPIHVGRALSSAPIEGMIGDDTGDNISNLNSKYCEITATYWAWQNDTQSDYIGICHYRRFFSFARLNPFSVMLRKLKFMKRKLLRPQEAYIYFNRIRCKTEGAMQSQIALFEKKLTKKLSHHLVDIICLQSGKCNLQLEETGVAKSRETREIVKQHYPDFYPYIDQLYRSHEFTYANMVIMKREVFDEYCTLLFGIMDKHRQMGYPECEQSRLYGYIAENVTAAFIEQKRAQGLTIQQLSSIYYVGK